MQRLAEAPGRGREPIAAVMAASLLLPEEGGQWQQQDLPFDAYQDQDGLYCHKICFCSVFGALAEPELP